MDERRDDNPPETGDTGPGGTGPGAMGPDDIGPGGIGPGQRDPGEIGPADFDTGRSASVRLRAGESSAAATQRRRMDAANRSLADALRITFGLLKAAMVVLVILYLVSGVQSINEGQRGVALRFGEQVRRNLDPGFQWSFPYPIGEIVQVDKGTVELPIALEFMPNLPGQNSHAAALDTELTRFNRGNKLDPGSDGSNITADLNIAHTQWNINYRRADHAKVVSNIVPEQERDLIGSIVRRAVVRVLATITIDDLLKTSSETIAGRVRSMAQRELDSLDTGIEVDRVVLSRKSPPMSLRENFNSVQTAAQTAGKAREDAMLRREQILNNVAGRAATVLISEINEYERLYELGRRDEARAQLGRIDEILEGRPVEIDGVVVEDLVSGAVTQILKRAETDASNRINDAIAGYERFAAKLEQFETNPRLMIAHDWSSAMAEFLSRDTVSTILLPEGVDAEMFINNDPDIARELDRSRKRQEADEAREGRNEAARIDAYRSERGIRKPER